MRTLLIILSTLLLSCGSSPTKRNAELVVTYYGKEVHRASPIYSSEKELLRALHSGNSNNIIFSSPRCPPCKTMITALKQSGHMEKVLILNLEEEWVSRLYQISGFRSIPIMLVVDPSGQPKKIVRGVSQIVMYLIINVEVDN